VVQTGPNGNLPQGYAAALNQNVASGAASGLETRINRFDDNGRLLHQRVLKSDNAAKYEIDYGSYDAAGNLLRYTLTNQDGTAYTNTYTYAYETREGYQESRIDGASTLFRAGSSVTAYDANGFRRTFTDTTASANTRSYVTDAEGRVLWENQGGRIERQLIVGGEVLGRFGDAVDEVNPRDGSGNPQFRQVADFNFGYQPINGNYPSASPGTYRVKAGDTLASIARGAYGDSRLWYRIAEANGLSGDRDLRVGQTLSVPTGVGTVHNDADSFKPYDPGKIGGDTTPNLPAPESSGGRGGCGGLGMLLVVLVAVAVTVFTAGVAAPAAGASLSSIMTAGAGALTSGSVGIVGGAAAAAAGSVASQLVGVAVGVQERFSWRQVALAGISGGVGAGVSQAAQATQGAWLASTQIEATVARAAIGNALTQGVAVATGLQSRFEWRGVAAAAVGSAVGQGVSSNVGAGLTKLLDESMGALATRTLSGFAAGAAATAMRGGRVVVNQVATDAFGNALGSSIAEAAMVQQQRREAEYSANIDREDQDLGQAMVRNAADAQRRAYSDEVFNALRNNLSENPKGAQIDPSYAPVAANDAGGQRSAMVINDVGRFLPGGGKGLTPLDIDPATGQASFRYTSQLKTAREQAIRDGVVNGIAGTVEAMANSYGVIGTAESRAAWALRSAEAGIPALLKFARNPGDAISNWWSDLNGNDPAAIRQAAATGTGVALGVAGATTLGFLGAGRSATGLVNPLAFNVMDDALLSGSSVSGSARNAALFEKYRQVLATTEAANPLVESLLASGRLPSNYVTREQALIAGWRPGKALDNYIPGGQLGGNEFLNSSGVLPAAAGRTWYEADVGLNSMMSRAKQPGTRLLYSSDGLLYVTPDHYNSAFAIGTWKSGKR
jgi:hypothetical protein